MHTSWNGYAEAEHTISGKETKAVIKADGTKTFSHSVLLIEVIRQGTGGPSPLGDPHTRTTAR